MKRPKSVAFRKRSKEDKGSPTRGGPVQSRGFVLMSEMKRLNVNVTPELLECLKYLGGDEKLGVLVERLLREHSEVERARKTLKLKFSERAVPGWKPGKPRANPE